MAVALSEDIHRDLALSFILDTDVNVFLTGSAGTGKTTLLKEVLKKTDKNVIVVAPTGVAAINAGGVTIHSFFSLPHKAFIPSNQIGIDADLFTTPKNLSSSQKFHQERRDIIQEMELLVIDEISMVRADLLDEIDFSLRRVRRDNTPFGGVQVLAIGDLLQLAPIVKNDVAPALREYYASPYFYDSLAWKRAGKVVVQLHKIYRQTDTNFINILNNIRIGQASQEDINHLNLQYEKNPDLSGTITLTTHNYKADKINTEELKKLKPKSKKLEASIEGKFYESAFPIPKVLEIKKGAQVMFVRNDPEQKYYNGKIGTVTKINNKTVYVKCDDQDNTIAVDPVEWSNDKYSLDPEGDKVIKKNIGKFIHYPLKLAWAVTVHKSQGLTFDKVVIDLKDSFATGQLYVALSRCRTLEGITFISTIRLHNIKIDQRIIQYNEAQILDSEIDKRLQLAKEQYANSYFLKTLQINKLKSHHQIWQSLIMDLDTEDIDPAVVIRDELTDEWQRLSILIDQGIHKIQEVLGLPEAINKEAQINAILDEFKKGPVDSISSSIFKSLKAYTSINRSATWHYKKYLKSYLSKIEKYTKRAKQLTYPFSKPPAVGEKDSDPEIEAMPTKEKAFKKPTRDITLEMWRSGMTIDKISLERGFVRSTIESHLTFWLEKGELQINDLIEKGRLEHLNKHIPEKWEGLTGDLKKTIPGDISYSEIRWVQIARSVKSNK